MTTAVDKTQAMLTYILTCPSVQSNVTYFNFGKEKDNSKQLITESNEQMSSKPYIDGSVLKKLYFTLCDFRSVTDEAVVKASGYDNENMSDYIDSQGIIDWIITQNESKNFPNFGTDCVVDSIEPFTTTPTFVGVDDTLSPPLARYDITIIVTYLDKSKQAWK